MGFQTAGSHLSLRCTLVASCLVEAMARPLWERGTSTRMVSAHDAESALSTSKSDAVLPAAILQQRSARMSGRRRPNAVKLLARDAWPTLKLSQEDSRTS